MEIFKTSFVLLISLFIISIPQKAWAPPESLYTKFSTPAEHCEPTLDSDTVYYRVALSEDQMDLAYNSDGYCSLREALVDAKLFYADYNVDIALSPTTSSTFTLTITGDNEDRTRSGDLDIDHAKTITISGSSSVETTLDAEGLEDRIFDISENSTVIIKDLILKGGNICGTSGSLSPCFGGAILNSGNLTLENVKMIENKASDSQSFDAKGGAVFNGGTLTLKNVLLQYNSTDNNFDDQKNSGGAIYSTGDLLIESSTFLDNLNNGTYGGAIFVDTSNADAVIKNSVISNNTCVSYGYGCHGAGIYATGNINESNSLTITNTTIANNNTNLSFIYSASSNMPAYGGGIFAAGNLVLSGVTIAGNSISRNNYSNTTTLGAGLFISDYSNITLNNTLIAGNNTLLGTEHTVSALELRYNNRITLNSNGANILENASLDTLELASTDQIGIASASLLGAFVSSSENGKSYYPILSESVAVDAGLVSDCESGTNLEKDQLGQNRTGTSCDVGAVECVDCTAAITETPPTDETPLEIETEEVSTPVSAPSVNNNVATENQNEATPASAVSEVNGGMFASGGSCNLQQNTKHTSNTHNYTFVLLVFAFWLFQRTRLKN